MTNCEQFLEYQKQWSKAACGGDEEKYRNLVREAHDFRDNNFTKADWEELIGQSSGRAKYEYTRMMNEKFPPKSEDDIPDDVMALFGTKEG